MATTKATNTFTQRLIGAMALDAAVYEDVEADRSATGQALLVVLASSLAAGVGSRGLVGTSFQGILFMSVLALIAWATWAFVTLQIGGRLMPEPNTSVDVGELLRTTGFAATPGLFRVLGIMPAATIPVFIISALWMLAAMIVAVRQALDYESTGRAIAVCVLGWSLAVAIAVALGLFFGPTLS
jgi:hypothetical protein